MPELREIIPPLTLRTENGRTIRAWDFKQKKNLLIAFLHADCAPCEEFLRALAANAAQWKESDGIVLAVTLDRPSRALSELASEQVILSVDQSGQATENFLGADAVASGSQANLGVFVTDRYNELAAQWSVRANHAFPPISEIAANLSRADISCDSCG